MLSYMGAFTQSPTNTIHTLMLSHTLTCTHSHASGHTSHTCLYLHQTCLHIRPHTLTPLLTHLNPHSDSHWGSHSYRVSESPSPRRPCCLAGPAPALHTSPLTGTQVSRGPSPISQSYSHSLGHLPAAGSHTVSGYRVTSSQPCASSKSPLPSNPARHPPTRMPPSHRSAIPFSQTGPQDPPSSSDLAQGLLHPQLRCEFAGQGEHRGVTSVPEKP